MITKPMETVASSSSAIPSTSDISVSPPLKKRRLQMSEEIDLNECCMCIGTYEDDIMEGAGAEWISCACGRWLHEDCAENRYSSGCERFLSLLCVPMIHIMLYVGHVHVHLHSVTCIASSSLVQHVSV